MLGRPYQAGQFFRPLAWTSQKNQGTFLSAMLSVSWFPLVRVISSGQIFLIKSLIFSRKMVEKSNPMGQSNPWADLEICVYQLAFGVEVLILKQLQQWPFQKPGITQSILGGAEAGSVWKVCWKIKNIFSKADIKKSGPEQRKKREQKTHWKVRWWGIKYISVFKFKWYFQSN
jgi:hypothetical protein